VEDGKARGQRSEVRGQKSELKFKLTWVDKYRTGSDRVQLSRRACCQERDYKCRVYKFNNQ